MQDRGKSQIDIFGPQTLAEIDADIQASAAHLGLEVEIYQSDDEATVVAWIEAHANDAGVAALLINPAGFSTSEGLLPAALSKLSIPRYEIHASNPHARGVQSTITPACTGALCGFGYSGYRLALSAIAASR